MKGYIVLALLFMIVAPRSATACAQPMDGDEWAVQADSTSALCTQTTVEDGTEICQDGYIHQPPVRKEGREEGNVMGGGFLDAAFIHTPAHSSELALIGMFEVGIYLGFIHSPATHHCLSIFLWEPSVRYVLIFEMGPVNQMA